MPAETLFNNVIQVHILYNIEYIMAGNNVCIILANFLRLSSGARGMCEGKRPEEI